MTLLKENMFCNFNFVKIHKIPNNSGTTNVREKISADFKSLDFYKTVDLFLTKFKTHCSIGGIYIVKSNFSLTFNQPLKTRQDLTFNA